MHMISHFGWRAAVSTVVSTLIVAFVFRKELASLEPEENRRGAIPAWLTILHIFFLAAVVLFAHHPDVFLGVFMLFLGLTIATREYQDGLKLREGLLVGFFLAGLVTLGSLQEYWLRPLITSLDGAKLYFGATALTAITDNAALTYLGSLVEGIGPDLKYALVAGAVHSRGSLRDPTPLCPSVGSRSDPRLCEPGAVQLVRRTSSPSNRDAPNGLHGSQ
jgi:hypothetical protein